MVRDSEATAPIIAHFCSTPECKMRQSTALHATRRNQVSAVVRQAKHYCVDRDADLQDVVADPPRLPGWERVVGDGRHLPEERPAVLDQPVSNPLAFPGSPHATLRFPKLLVAGAKPRRVLPRAGAITSRFESLEKLWRRRDERTSFGPSRRDSDPCLGRDYVFVGVVARYDLLGRERVDATKTCS